MAETSSASHLLRRMRWSSWTHRRDALSSAVLITKNGGFLILEIWWSVRGLRYTVYIYIHTHTYTHVHLHTYVCTYVYSYLPTCLPACLHIDTTNIHTYIHACMHTYIHTYLHCIALHYITLHYIHTLWCKLHHVKSQVFFGNSLCFHQASHEILLSYPTVGNSPNSIPSISQGYPNDTPIISKYFSISQYFTRLPIWHPHLEVSFSSARDPHVLRGISRISSWRMTATVGSQSWEATKMEDAIENDNIGNQQKTRFQLVSVVF